MQDIEIKRLLLNHDAQQVFKRICLINKIIISQSTLASLWKGNS